MYNYHNYYNRPNYYDSSYRESYQTQYNNSGNNGSKNEFNSINLPSEYDPSDWVPSYQPYFDRDAYKLKINGDLKSVKVFSQCCEIFCVIMIKNDNDGIKSDKKRVFFEVILKNYAFFDSMLIDASKKKCLIENIINSKDISKLATENIFKNCGIDSPYESLPLKQACVKTMNSHCEKAGFNKLILSSTSYITSSDNSNAKKCEAPIDCLNLPSDKEVTEEQKKKCGGKLLSLFSQNLMKPEFGSFVTPCENIEPKTSFVEIKQTPKSNISASASLYVDTKDPIVKANVDKLNNLAEGVVQSSNISIDQNTASRAATISDSEMNAINKDTDSLVQDAIVQTTPTVPYNGEGNFPKTNNSSEFIKINGAFYTMLIFFVALLC